MLNQILNWVTVYTRTVNLLAILVEPGQTKIHAFY